MVEVGARMRVDAPCVVDKHCFGGLSGSRTTPIVVAIVAANGLLMPKTSSRAITSPAGTADVMETLAPVNLDIATLRRVVEAEGGRSEEHTSELQSLMRISYAVFCLKKKHKMKKYITTNESQIYTRY